MKYPNLKYWLLENNITQKELRDRTHLSIGTVNKLVNEGKATKSIIRYMALELGFTEQEFKAMLKPHVSDKKVKK